MNFKYIILLLKLRTDFIFPHCINTLLRNFAGYENFLVSQFFSTLCKCCAGRYLNENRRPAGMESTPGTKAKDTQKSVSFLVSNSNPLTLEFVAKSEEHVTRYPLALLYRRISDKWVGARGSRVHMYAPLCFRVHTRDEAILHCVVKSLLQS